MNKEQQKQHLIDMMKADEELGLYEETLEEASWRYNPLKKLDGEFIRAAFAAGAKWQAERMYSEEEVIAFGEFIFKHTLLAHSKGVKNLFEQFKNK
jgi:hypothetical protein